jgi:hypothetical protein
VVEAREEVEVKYVWPHWVFVITNPFVLFMEARLIEALELFGADYTNQIQGLGIDWEKRTWDTRQKV